MSPFLSYAERPSKRMSVAEEKEALAAAKAELVGAVAVTDRGFSASKSQQDLVRRRIEAVVAYPSNTSRSIEGEWTLAWTDAPDITGLRGGPLGVVGRIGQEIDAESIVNVIEYEPMPWVPTSIAFQQRVILAYSKAGDEVTLDLKGIGGKLKDSPFSQIGNNPFDVVGWTTLPFGKFRVLFNDGDLRVVRTGQGYYSVNLRRRR